MHRTDAHPHPSAPDPTERGADARIRWAPLLALAGAMLAVTSDMSIPAVALPSIGAAFGADAATVTWVMLAYSLPMAAACIPAGRWVDRADPRRVLLVSMAGVTLATALVAAAPTLGLLVAARFGQGLFGALTLAAYLPVIRAAVPERLHGRAIGAVVTIMTVGGTAGAPLGGLVADQAGWRAVFLVKVPVLLLAAAGAVRGIPDTGRGLPAPGAGLWRETLVLGAAVGALLLALDTAGTTPWVAAGLGLCALLLGLGWSRIAASAPVLALLRRRRFGLTTAGMFLLSCNAALSVFLVPFLLAEVLGRGPEVTGMLLLVQVGSMALVTPLAGWLADRYGPLPTTIGGAALTTVVTAALVAVGPATSLLVLAVGLALAGVSFGLTNTPIIAAVMAAAPATATGTAGGVSSTARTVAMTVGPAATALGWTLAGGGITGFRVGVVALAAIQGLGVVALVAAQRSRTPHIADDGDRAEARMSGAPHDTFGREAAPAPVGEAGGDDVRAVIGRYEAAFNADDATSMNALFTDDASFVNFGGRLVVGREELRRAQEFVFAPDGPLAGVTVHYAIEHQTFLGPTAALVHARQRSAAPGGEGDPMEALFTVLLTKSDRGWRIRCGQNTPVS